MDAKIRKLERCRLLCVISMTGNIQHFYYQFFQMFASYFHIHIFIFIFYKITFILCAFVATIKNELNSTIFC